MKGKGLITFLSYIAIGMVAIALVLAKIFSALSLSSGLVNAMTLIAQVIAYAITAVFAFQYAKARKNIGWMIAFIIFVIIILVFLVLNFNI